MIILKRIDFDKIHKHALAELPDEACGLIAGTEADGVKRVEKVYLLTNTDSS